MVYFLKTLPSYPLTVVWDPDRKNMSWKCQVRCSPSSADPNVRGKLLQMRGEMVMALMSIWTAIGVIEGGLRGAAACMKGDLMLLIVWIA